MSDATATVLSIYECFGRGDVPGILRHLDPAVRWDRGVRRTAVPYLSDGTGTDHVLGFFEALGAQLEITQFELGTIACAGNEVFARVRISGRNRVTGLAIDEAPEVHHWVVGDHGLVTDFTHVGDWGVHEAAAPGGAAGGAELRVAGDTVGVLASGGQFELFTVRGPVGSGPPPHAHPWREAYVGLAGEVEVMVEGETTVVRPGDSVCVEPGRLHAYRILTAGTSFLVATGGGRASWFFADVAANVTGEPGPDTLARLVDVARRNGLSSPLFDEVPV